MKPPVAGVRPPVVVTIMTFGIPSSGMTIVVDIACPRCGRTDAVRKERIGEYRCVECGFAFDHEDVEPA